MPLFLGIDPGKQGAVAAISVTNNGAINVIITDTPVLNSTKGGTIYDILEMHNIITAYTLYDGLVHVGIEKVHSMPSQGVKSMFSMGEGYGIWQGLLVASGLRFSHVTPQAWKKVVLAGYGIKDKNVAYTVGTQLYPKAVLKGPRGGLLDGRADALCIAEHIKRMG